MTRFSCSLTEGGRHSPFATRNRSFGRLGSRSSACLDLLQRQPLVLHGVNQRLERLDLQPDVGVRIRLPHISTASHPAAMAATAASPGV